MNYFWADELLRKGDSKEAALDGVEARIDNVLNGKVLEGVDLDRDLVRNRICGIVEHVYGRLWFAE
jgi:hypothetical protein